MLLQVIELGYYCLVGRPLALGPCGLHSCFTRLAAGLPGCYLLCSGVHFFGSRLVENCRVRDAVSHRVVKVSGPLRHNVGVGGPDAIM
jgi:hypothetical protein